MADSASSAVGTRSRTRNTQSTSMNSSLAAAADDPPNGRSKEASVAAGGAAAAAPPPLEKEKKRKKTAKMVNAQEVIKTIEDEARQAELQTEDKKANKKTKKVNFKDEDVAEAAPKTPSKPTTEHEATPLKPKRGRKKKLAEDQLGSSTPAPELVPIEAAAASAQSSGKKAAKKATTKKSKKGSTKKAKKPAQEATSDDEDKNNEDADFKLQLENESSTEAANEVPTLMPIAVAEPQAASTTATEVTESAASVPATSSSESGTVPGEPPAEVKPKRTGGARIVIPKEVTSIVKIITKQNGEVEERVEKIVVESRERKAGPRIVVPVIENQTGAAGEAAKTGPNKQSKRKMPEAGKEATVTAVKKTRDASALRVNTVIAKPETPGKPIKALAKPDFQAIHQRQIEGMESIDDHNRRVMQRHTTLTSAVIKPTSSSTPQQASAVADISNLSAIKPSRAMSLNRNTAATMGSPGDLQPKKPLLKTATSTSQLSSCGSQIPIMVKKSTKTATTTTTTENVLEMGPLKTPTRKIHQRDTSLVLNRSALKTKAQNDLNASTDRQIPLQLATSSFVKRKSFDLNASLSRELHYKPYTGKLKPIDLEIKPIVGCSLGKLMSMTSCITNNKNL